MPSAAKVVSTAFQPLINCAAALTAAGVLSKAGPARTLAAATAVTVIPYAADRLLPGRYSGVAACAVGAAALAASGTPRLLKHTAMSIAAGGGVLELMRLHDRASGHTGTATFAALWAGRVLGGPWRLAPAVVPLVAGARIATGEHTPRQTLLGAAAGSAAFAGFCLLTFKSPAKRWSTKFT